MKTHTLPLIRVATSRRFATRVSHPGHPRFFWSLKHEWTNYRQYEDLNAARLSVFKYIETFYNSTRRHQTLAYQSPDQYEAAY